MLNSHYEEFRNVYDERLLFPRMALSRTGIFFTLCNQVADLNRTKNNRNLSDYFRTTTIALSMFQVLLSLTVGKDNQRKHQGLKTSTRADSLRIVMDKYKRLRVYLGTIGAMLFWGIAFVWTKIVFEYYGPFTTLLFRLIISAVILTLYARVTGKIEKVARKDWSFFLLLAFLQPFCYFIGESFGLLLVSPTLASIMIGLIPVIAPFFAYLFYREKLSILNIFGLIISFLGLAIFTTTGGAHIEASTKGLLLLLFAVVSAVGCSLVLKNLSNRYRPLTIVRVQNMIGGIYFLPFMLGFELKDTLAVNPPPIVIIDLILLALLGSSLAFIFITVSIRELGIGRTNIFTNIIPVITAIAAYFMLGESFTERKIIGMAIIISGIFLAQIRKRSRDTVIYER